VFPPKMVLHFDCIVWSFHFSEMEMLVFFQTFKLNKEIVKHHSRRKQ